MQLLSRQLRASFSNLNVPSPLVSVKWFTPQNLGKVKFVDGTWFLPSANRNGHQEFLQERIPGSVFFDIDVASKQDTPLPHMLPSVEHFEQYVSSLGLTNEDNIVVYDRQNIFSSCRVYWTFRVFGHKNVSVLNGGFPYWKKNNLPVETTPPHQPAKSNYKATFNGDMVRNIDQVVENIKKQKKGDKDASLILDMRPAGRFTGEDPDIRPGGARGHMPGAKSVPSSTLTNPETGEMLEVQRNRTMQNHEVEKILSQWTKDIKNQKYLATCGSGVTACIMYVALERLGAKNVGVYDGSWAEYGQAKDRVEIVVSHK